VNVLELSSLLYVRIFTTVELRERKMLFHGDDTARTLGVRRGGVSCRCYTYESRFAYLLLAAFRTSA